MRWMKSGRSDDIRRMLADCLSATGGFLFALDGDGRVASVLPPGRAFGELPADALPGMASAEVAAAGAAAACPFRVTRIPGGRLPDGRVHPFSRAYPVAAAFLAATPLSGPLSSDAPGARAATEHAKALEEMNRKLKRRSRRLKAAMAILERRNQQIIKEMNLAVELQKSLLPKRYPDTELLTFTHRYIPLAMVGGDLFDMVKLSEERVGIIISDVSGHGVAPAFITAMLKGSFDYLVARDPPPAALMGRLNDEFSKIIDTDHYVTACYAVFDFGDMTCRYCNAGHPPQLIAHADGTFAELEPRNPVIGMMEDYEFVEAAVPFRYGDVLCFYTDGILEARDAAGELFGVEGVRRALEGSAAESLDGMADRLLTDLIQFMKDPYFEDDITILLGQVIETI